MNDPPNRIFVNGVDLAFIDRGEGDPVVLVHGSLGDFRDWHQQVEELAEHYRAVAISRRHHWPNDPPGSDARYAIADHAADLAGLIDALGIAPAHLIGSSYGAATVLTMAATRPGYARSLVLGEPALLPWLRGSAEGTAHFDTFRAEAWEPAGTAARQGDAEAMVGRFIDGVIGPGTFEQIPPPGRAALLDNASEMALELAATEGDLFGQLTCDDLRRVAVPALLLDGADSPQMFRLVQDLVQDCLPDVERVTVPGASHDIHTDNPSGWMSVIGDFLDRH